MVQNPALTSVSGDRIAAALPELLIKVLGAEITAADIAKLQTQTQIFAIIPGQSFWKSSARLSGIYVILAGKVWLFVSSGAPVENFQDERVATLTIGKSFDASTLFPDDDFRHYTAKAALVVGGAEILVGFISRECLQSLWGKYPQIQSHLSERAQYLDAIIRGEIEPSALHPQLGLSSRHIHTLAPTPQRESSARQVKTTATPDRFKEAYFPTPSQKMGQWWKKVTHNYPFYAQHSASDCSAACVVMVGRYWGREFNINRLRELAYVSRDGA